MSARTMFRMVGDFHQKFGLVTDRDGPPQMLDPDTFRFREGFLREELEETVRAYHEGDMEGFADGLVDLVYVALGTGHMARLPLDRIFREVQRANMAKERASSASDSRSKRGSSLDVVKPEGWTPPDVARILREAAEQPPFELTDRDRRYLELADLVSTWSKDPTTQVGAVLVGTDPREIALGYNGFPRGITDLPERLADRGVKLRLTQHAERNVLDNSRFDVRGGTLYVTFFPCSECAKSVVSRGIGRVVCPPPSDREPWSSDASWTRRMFDEVGITLTEARI